MTGHNNLHVTIFNNDGRAYIVKSSHMYRTSIFLVDKEGTRFPAQDVEEDHNLRAISHITFDKEFNAAEDSLVKVVKKTENIPTYKLRSDNPRVKKIIDEVTWNVLPDTLKSLYRQEREVVEEVVSFDVTFVDISGDQGEVEMYTPQEVRANVERFNFRKNKRARVYGSKVYFPDSRGSLFSKEVIKVDFYAKDYNGETTKVYDKKRNGEIYADRRGTYVNDYPEVSFSTYILIEDIPQLKASSKQGLEKEMQRYVDHITLTSQLNEAVAVATA